MAMFDQQPMGPVPARRPILMPPDPQLEQLLADPGMADVSLVGPVPMELREPLPRQRRPAMWRRLRWVVAFLLVVPTIFELVIAGGYLFGDNADGPIVRQARLIAAAIIVVVLVIAHLLFLSVRHRRARG